VSAESKSDPGEGSKKRPLDNLMEESVGFNVKSFFRTFLYVIWENELIGSAIKAQDFQNVLSPTKYLSSSIAFISIVGLVWAGAKPHFSLDIGDRFGLLLLFSCGMFILFQSFYLSLSIRKSSAGLLDDTVNLTQVYYYPIASIISGFAVMLLFEIIDSFFFFHVAGAFGALFEMMLLPFLVFNVGVNILFSPVKLVSSVFNVGEGKSIVSILLGFLGGIIGAVIFFKFFN
jgi:hypothetical protein